jgi:hypothetical protein
MGRRNHECNHLNDFFFLNLRDMFLREEEGQEIS